MVNYTEEAIIINALGDEWGGGELWDLYEAVMNSDEFFHILPYIISVFFGLVGIGFLVLYFSLNDRKNLYLALGVGFAVIGLLTLILTNFM
jgi:hypothetical protein